MTDDEKKIAEAIHWSVDVRLPEDFADRLVQRIREGNEDSRDCGVLGKGLARVVLVAASVTLLLGLFRLFLTVLMLDAMFESCISTRFARPSQTGSRQISS